MKPWQLLLIGVLFGLLAAGLVLLVATQPVQSAVMLLNPTQSTSIKVDVDGAVMNPGLYEIPSGSRINEAVLAAGGLAPAADTTAINLAALARDGSKILIPGIAATAGQDETASTPSDLIDLNTVTAAELEQLPGIGLQKANAIVAYRQTYGNFQDITDLLYVPGIGQSIIDTIYNYVTVKQ